MTQLTIGLVFLSIALVFIAVAVSSLSIVTWALYRKVENVNAVSARVDVLDSAYQKLRASKAGNVASIKSRSVSPVPGPIADALNDLTDEERSLFA